MIGTAGLLVVLVMAVLRDPETKATCADRRYRGRQARRGAATWLEHHPAKWDHRPDKDARENKGRDGSHVSVSTDFAPKRHGDGPAEPSYRLVPID